MLVRQDITNMTFKFDCQVTGVPKKGKRSVAVKSPENLDEMLRYLRGMGYRPEDVAITDMRVEYEHANYYSDL